MTAARRIEPARRPSIELNGGRLQVRTPNEQDDVEARRRSRLIREELEREEQLR